MDQRTESTARSIMCREEAASVRMLANLLFHSPCALCITDATQVCAVFESIPPVQGCRYQQEG